MVNYSNKELQEDIAFLAHRQTRASSIGGDGGKRFTGLSSNSIVSIIYGHQSQDEQYMPSDKGDYQACVRTVEMLPVHRKEFGMILLNRAFDSLRKQYQDEVTA
jgi:hypothetical protein